MSALFARHALLPQGWCRDVALRWDPQGTLTEVAVGAPEEGPAVGLAVPGMINLHSHAFQRAMAGLTERGGEGPDSFWTWRDLMYRFVARLTPDHLEAIAAMLFSECLRHGYTSVCEFHYVQRDPDGALYPRPAETAERVLAAAREAGIGLTLLPALYRFAGFGDAPLSPAQRRFETDADLVLRLVEALEPARDANVEVGVAPHSLRAASVEQIRALLQGLPADRPVHLHIAEQVAEVEQCLAHTGRRPVEHLMHHLEIGPRWCLVHATHLNEAETVGIARLGAVVGLCPTTEANLGDGLFPLEPFLAAGGRFGVGSDSHVSQSPVEELRWLEYGQRLAHRRRNVAVSAAQRSVGQRLWEGALDGGARASGRPVGALAVGRRADVVVLDDAHPNLEGLDPEDVLGTLLFNGNDPLVRDVMVGGAWVVRDRQHLRQAEIAVRYRQTIAELRALRA